MESVLFGGGPNEVTPNRLMRQTISGDPPERTGLIHMISINNHQQMWDIRIKDYERIAGKLPFTHYVGDHIPIWWTSAMLSERYWKDTIPKSMAKDGFLRPTLGLKYDFYLSERGDEYFPARPISQYEFDKEREAAVASQQSRRVIEQRWEARKQQMKQLRPWYDDEYRKWKMTPCTLSIHPLPSGPLSCEP